MTEIDDLNIKIEQAKATLRDLWRQKKKLKAKEKSAKPKKPSSTEREEQVYMLAQRGLTLREIASQIGLTYPTVRYYLWSKIWKLSNDAVRDEPYSYEARAAKAKEINDRLPHGLSKRVVL